MAIDPLTLKTGGMKRHQIVLGLLFVALPFFVIAFLNQEVEQSGETVPNPQTPTFTSPCTGKSLEVPDKAYPNRMTIKPLKPLPHTASICLVTPQPKPQF
jgi:hypothetical protein